MTKNSVLSTVLNSLLRMGFKSSAMAQQIDLTDIPFIGSPNILEL
ncbi:MAG: hypothetical protein ACXWFC_05105 [Nitrososphaeraceae archaeon]